MARLECTAIGGGGDVKPEAVELSLEPTEDGGVTAHVATRAFVERSLCWEPVDQPTRDDTDPFLSGDPAVAAVAAVPIYHEDIPYGVVTIYGTDTDVFTDRELTILSTIGDVIATGIHAREAQQFVDVDTNVELEVAITDEDLFVTRLAAATGGVVEFRGPGWRTVDGDPYLLSVDETDHGQVERALVELSADATILAERADGIVLQCRSPELPFDELLTRHVDLRSIVAESRSVRLRLTCPNERTAQRVFDRLQDRHGSVDLRKYQERYDAPTDGVRDEQVLEKLTPRQRTVLGTCFRAGFYDQPRRVNGEELASSLDISRATFHQHRKIAERKILEEVFSGQPVGSADPVDLEWPHPSRG